MLDKFGCLGYNNKKGKTLNGYAKTMNYLKNNVIALGGWRYFFMVNANNSRVIINVIM